MLFVYFIFKCIYFIFGIINILVEKYLFFFYLIDFSLRKLLFGKMMIYIEEI